MVLNFSNEVEKKQFVMTDGIPSSKNIIANINLNGPIFNNNSNILGNNLNNYINPSQVKSYLEELKELEKEGPWNHYFCLDGDIQTIQKRNNI